MRALRYIGILFVLALGGIYWAYSTFLAADFPEPPAELTGTLFTGEMDHGGHTRSYNYYVPANLAENPALVLAFHGSQGDGAQARVSYAYGFDRLADQHGFIVVYPDGFENHWNDCRGSGDYSANHQNIDDVGFVRSLVTFFAERYGADESQVVATGISNGGHMAFRLAYEAPELAKAHIAFAAAVPAGDNLDCDASGAAVNMAIVNGTGDPLVPPAGGVQTIFGVAERGTVLSMEDSIAYWARIAGYGVDQPEIAKLPDTNAADDSFIVQHSWDDVGKPLVRLYKVQGGGHTIPTAQMKFPKILGTTNADVEGAELVWSFLNEITNR